MDNFVDVFILEQQIRAYSKNEKLLNNFRFVMKAYLRDNEAYTYLCNLDEMSIFELPCFKENYFLITGGAVTINNETILIIAKNYSGKSSLMCSMIEQGAELVTDDLIMIDKKSLKIAPLKKPMCFRKSAIDKYHITQNVLESKGIEYRMFSDEYGDRFLINPFDILKGNFVSETQNIHKLYFLRSEYEEENYLKTLSQSIRGLKVTDMPVLLSFIQNTKAYYLDSTKELMKNI